MYSAGNFKHRIPVVVSKLQASKVKIAGPGDGPTVFRKYRDWSGKYSLAKPDKEPNAYNRPLKKLVFDTWADTRGIWLKP